jgi:hypothetical protein
MKRTPLKRKTALKAKQPLRSSKTPLRASKRAKGSKVATKKKKTMAQLKKELDRVFSIYIRKKYEKSCYTCGKTDCALQCGHFVSRQYLATRWDENNCRPQCVGCNVFGGGKPLDFEERLKKDLDGELVEKMKASRHQIIKLDCNWYEEQIKFYKDLCT